MPTVTKPSVSTSPLRRRECVLGLAGLMVGHKAWSNLSTTATTTHTLVASWQQEHGYALGLVHLDQQHWHLGTALNLPTRAHGFWPLHDGSILATARRPGDWLVRWWPQAQHPTQWHWIDPDHRFNGHVVALNAHTVATTETRLDDGSGYVALRHANSLERLAMWPTHGRDPHQLLVLPQNVGAFAAGCVVVANGGIATQPETGRRKHLQQPMNASFVVLSPQGTLLGQWQLDDAWLSIRHLAWDEHRQRLGIALQAEHPDTSQRQAAAVLAVWDGKSLRLATKQPALAGYGGDIVALPDGGFAVSCPRANAVALFDANGGWLSTLAQQGAYALARQEKHWWVASPSQLVAMPTGQALEHQNTGQLPQLVWDNHWKAL